MLEASRLRRVIPVAIFAAVLLLGLALAGALHVSGQARGRAKVLGDVDEIARAVEIRTGQNVALLRAVKALLEVEPQRVTRGRFGAFISNIDLPHAYPGIRGVGFAARFPVGEEQEARRRYDLPRDVHPPTTEPVRGIVALLEPNDDRNDAALGYDMYSEPTRRAAMAEAERTDQPAATAPVVLVQEITQDVQNGFLIYLTARDEDGKAIGYAYAPFRAGDFFADAGVRRLLQNYAVHVDDVTTEPHAALFSTLPNGASLDPDAVKHVNVAARTWRIAVSPIARSSEWSELTPTLGAAALAFLIASLVALAYRDQQRAQEVESALAQARLKALADREVLLQEMNHRIKNAIARIGAIARSTVRSAADLDDFQKSFSGRLAAMAAAQDLVTKTNDAGASLLEVLRAELDQIFKADDPRLTIGGPAVQLDSRQTQAMALVTHELATNAAKHGAARDPVGTLSVTWRLRDDGSLELDWIESCVVAPVENRRTGFGSRLKAMIVEGELHGRIERDLRPDGLRLRLQIPMSG